MKKTLVKIATVGLFAVAVAAAPLFARAQDSTNAPAKSGATGSAKHKKHDTLPFHGKLAAVDTAAMTLKVGERTFAITSETKITKDGQPAVLSDGVVGEMVGGAYKKTADGKLEATTVNFGMKSKGNAKPAAEGQPSGSSEK